MSIPKQISTAKLKVYTGLFGKAYPNAALKPVNRSDLQEDGRKGGIDSHECHK